MVKRRVGAIRNGKYDKKMMRGYEVGGKGRNEGGSINGYHEKRRLERVKNEKRRKKMEPDKDEHSEEDDTYCVWTESNDG